MSTPAPPRVSPALLRPEPRRPGRRAGSRRPRSSPVVNGAAPSPTARGPRASQRVPLRRRATTSRATRIRCSITPPTARRTSRRSLKSGSVTNRLHSAPASPGGRTGRRVAPLTSPRSPTSRRAGMVRVRRHPVPVAVGRRAGPSRATRTRCSTTPPTARPTSRRSPRCGFFDEPTAEAGRLHATGSKGRAAGDGGRCGQVRRGAAGPHGPGLGDTRSEAAADPRAGPSRATRTRCSITRRRATRTT